MAAWAYLTQNGFNLLEKNYRCPLGEIDVVAEKDGRLRFVEIKTRTGHRFGLPQEAVHPFKQRKLAQLAAWYLKARGKSGMPVSFDVLAVTWKGSEEPLFNLIENAFGLPGE